jgi:PAS domain S-box-containing protein
MRASPLARYAMAICAATVAIALRLALDPVWDLRLPFITFFPAVMLSAWLGGLGPGLVTTLLCAAAADYFWIEPKESWVIGRAADVLGLLIFCAVGALISALNEAWRRGTIRVVEAGQRLAESEARTAGILDAALDCIITIDHEGRIVDFNASAERAFGYRRSEIVGLPMADLIIPPDLRDRHRQGLARYLVTGEAIVLDRRIEMTAMRADGTELPIELSIARVQVMGPPLFTAHVRDISERQRAERERAALVDKERAARVDLELVTSRTPMLLTRCSRDRRYVFVNRALAEFFDRPAEDIIGRPIVELLGRTAYERLTPYIERVLGGEPLEFEIELPYPHAGRRFMRTLYTPDRNERGEVIGWIASITDITERKRAEDELRRSKDQFLATVSHELRGPLNAVLGWAELLRAGTLDEASYQRGLEAVYANAKRQAKLIEDLLDVSRIVSGQLHVTPSPVDLPGVVRAALETIHPSAEAKGIQIETDVDPSIRCVLGDATRLQQILSNLLTNAVKFTPESGEVRLIVRRSHDMVELIVSDTGRGIAPDFLPLVFEPFRQADGSTTRTHGGLGLGLAIVKHLAEAHGGTVAVHSAGEGRGATFTVQLPIGAVYVEAESSADQAQTTSRKSANGRGLAGVAVLVVDDDPDSRDVVTAFLQDASARVVTASSAAEALSVLEREPVDILLADIAMPGEDGYALIRKVRALESPIKAVPAVALTSFTGNGHGQQALQAGFQLHLGKPIESRTLIDALASLASPMASL